MVSGSSKTADSFWMKQVLPCDAPSTDGAAVATPCLDRFLSIWTEGNDTYDLTLTAPDGTHIILDCGTGLRMLGNRWSQSAAAQGGDSHILVTHYHWDHIQGIPFFHPFFEPQNHFYFYSFESRYLGPDSLRKALE